jgi:glucan phosphoethanolaminetransferase (alkaline phosphatase superfamily)
MIIITFILFLIFITLSALHFYWGFGGKWGSRAVVPTKENGIPVFVPRTISTFVVAVGLLCFGLFYLINYGFVEMSFPIWLDKTGFWIIASIFILRAIGDFNYVGFFKKHKSSKFAINDTKYYSPLCLLIGILTLVLEFYN